MSLNRKTKKKSAVEDEDILDSTEQEALVEEFRAEARRQAKRARTMFQILFIVAACCYLGCFVNGILLPWDMDHESVFKDLIPYETFQVYYAFSFVTFLVLSAIVRDQSGKASVWKYSIAVTGVVLSIMLWGTIFAMFSVTSPVLYWLPAANLIGLVLVIYVDSDEKGLMKDVENLEQYKYEFKKV